MRNVILHLKASFDLHKHLHFLIPKRHPNAKQFAFDRMQAFRTFAGFAVFCFSSISFRTLSRIAFFFCSLCHV